MRNQTAAVFLCFACMSVTGCAATLADRQTDLSGVRTKSDVEARLGTSVQSETWDNGWVIAQYPVHVRDPNRAGLHAFMSGFTLGLWDLVAVPSEMLRQKPRATLLYARDGKILGWKAPWGSGPPLDSILVSPVVRIIESGQCPLMSHCVLQYEAGARRLADWLGRTLPPSIELKFRLARQIAADADAGRLSVSAASNRLIVLDADTERRYPESLRR